MERIKAEKSRRKRGKSAKMKASDIMQSLSKAAMIALLKDEIQRLEAEPDEKFAKT